MPINTRRNIKASIKIGVKRKETILNKNAKTKQAVS